MFHTLIHARPIFHRHRTPIDRQRMGRVGWESAWECKIKNDKESEERLKRGQKEDLLCEAGKGEKTSKAERRRLLKLIST